MMLMVLKKSRERQDFYSLDKYLHLIPIPKEPLKYLARQFARNNFPREGNKNEA